MPISVTCPGCDRGLKAPDTSAGRKIKCPKCGSAVLVPDADEETEDLEPKKKKPVAAKASKSSRRDADEDEERPRRRSRDDEDDEEEEDEEPRRGKKKRKAAAKGQPQMGMGLGSLGAGVVAMVLGLMMWLTGNSLMAWIGVGLAGVGLLLGIFGLVIAMQHKGKNVDVPRIGAAVNVLAILLCIALPIFASRSDPPVKQVVQEDKKPKKKEVQKVEFNPIPEPEIRKDNNGSLVERQQSLNNLRQLGLAMHNYHDQFKKFPKATITSKDGKPLLSWRVALLPFLEQKALYDQFKLDEPWDSEHNKTLIDKMPKIYQPVRFTRDPGGHQTFYQVFTGKHGPFGNGQQPRITGFTDGSSHTFLIVEADKAVVWTKPGDVEHNDAKAPPPLGELYGNGICVVMADGTPRFLFRHETTPAMIHAAITPAGGEPNLLPP